MALADVQCEACMTAAGGILEQSWKAQMEELEVRLARSKAKWKIVIGHHPLKSQLQVLSLLMAQPLQRGL